jgi:hypothetical protein
MRNRLMFVCSSILVLALAVSCGGGGNETPSLPPAAGGGAPAGGGAAAPAGNATVTGKIAFEGTAPPNEKIQMSADPYCQQHNPAAVAETVKVTDGGLENVIVFVKNAPAGSYAAPTDPVMIDQHDCHYVPHVFTMQANQPLKIKNSDATLHNIHAWAEKNMPFNIGQPVQNMETTKTFTTEEVPLPIRCDVHKWMGAFVGVFPHPFHTVSKGGGAYELKLPAGSYEVVAWHEKYGQQTGMVTVADNGKAELNFTFKADAKVSD